MKTIPTINRENLAKLESFARDLGFRIRGRSISEEEGKEARATLHLAPKSFGKDANRRHDPYPMQPEATHGRDEGFAPETSQ